MIKELMIRKHYMPNFSNFRDQTLFFTQGDFGDPRVFFLVYNKIYLTPPPQGS